MLKVLVNQAGTLFCENKITSIFGSIFVNKKDFCIPFYILIFMP